MASVQRLQHASVPMPPGGEDDARRFYGGALGMNEVEPPATLRHLRIVWFQAGDGGHEIHCFTEDGFGPNSPEQHLCLQVDDIDAFRRRLGEHDVPIEETTAIHNRPRCFIRDPFGNKIELTQILGPYQEPAAGRSDA
jgi:catechol 2,3-dioxygenase-like lactoylglutathione lyase family enzyme